MFDSSRNKIDIYLPFQQKLKRKAVGILEHHCMGYGNNLNCIWTIISDPGSRIHLSFNDFDLESQFDFLAVKDGDSPDSPILGTFTGAEVPSHLTSNSHILRLEFQADHSMSGRGFNITYNSE
uniref:CUB domain-containing protein n=1 Tax=Chelonoidis abingdonii TaxID=106734 RepID=A0A8C0FVS0_CHEAB